MHGFISGLYMSSRWLLFPPLCFDYCCFVKRFENKKYKISNIVVLQYLLENRLFHFYMKGHLDVGKITSNLWIGLSGIDLLKILYSNLRVQTRNLFINFSQLIYQNLQFSKYTSLIYMVIFTSKHMMFECYLKKCFLNCSFRLFIVGVQKYNLFCTLKLILCLANFLLAVAAFLWILWYFLRV